MCRFRLHLDPKEHTFFKDLYKKMLIRSSEKETSIGSRQELTVYGLGNLCLGLRFFGCRFEQFRGLV